MGTQIKNIKLHIGTDIKHKQKTNEMFSTRHISQGFAKYLSPKLTLSSTQRVALAPAAAHEKPEHTSYPSPYKLDGKFGPTSTLQLVSRRYAHTDVPVPDFTSYRRDATKDPSAINADSDMPRRAFTYRMVGGMGVVGAHAGKSFITDFLSTMSASADVLAVAQTEVDLSVIPPGKSMTLKWRGKPLFVRHRTPEEIEQVRAVDVSKLGHAQRTKIVSKTTDFSSLLVCAPTWDVYQSIMPVTSEVSIARATDPIMMDPEESDWDPLR